jgi:hypothetical protein
MPSAFAQTVEADTRLPEWAQTAQSRVIDGVHYFVGVSPESASREEALEKAWLNALSKIVESQFAHIKSDSDTRAGTETQSSAQQVTNSSAVPAAQPSPAVTPTAENKSEDSAHLALLTMLRKINFDSLTEAADKGSPYTESKRVNQQTVHVAYRLLRWHSDSIRLELERQKNKKNIVQKNFNFYNSLMGPTGKRVGQLKVISKPEGARILIDGKHVGDTPAIFSRIAEGSYQLRIELDSYQAVDGQAVVKTGAMREYAFPLSKMSGKLVLSSQPKGALVFLGNIPLGRTPLEVLNDLGKAQVRLELDDYFSEAREVNFTERARDEKFEMRARDGKISVATVRIDGRVVGKTPLKDVVVAGGRRRVNLKLDEFADFNSSVFVRASRTATVSAKLTAVDSSQPVAGDAPAKIQDDYISTSITAGKWISGAGLVMSLINSELSKTAKRSAEKKLASAATPEVAEEAKSEISVHEASVRRWERFSFVSGVSAGTFILIDLLYTPVAQKNKVGEVDNRLKLSVGAGLFRETPVAQVFMEKDL